jgi:excisionase family DNA binding protein
VSQTVDRTVRSLKNEASVGSSDVLNALPPLIPVPTAAKVLGLSRSAAYRYAAAGELPIRRLGGRVYIVTALLNQLISTADTRTVA